MLIKTPYIAKVGNLGEQAGPTLTTFTDYCTNFDCLLLLHGHSLVPRPSHRKTTRGEEGIGTLPVFSTKILAAPIRSLVSHDKTSYEVLFECALKRVDTMAVYKEGEIVSV